MSHTISPSPANDELFLPVLVQKVSQSENPDFIWQNINIVSMTIGEIRKLFFDFSAAPGIIGKQIVSTEVYFSPADIAVGNVIVEANFQVLVLVDTTIQNSILAGQQYNLYCYVTLDDGEILNIIGQALFSDSSLTLLPPTGTLYVIDIFSDNNSINVNPHIGHVDVEINTEHSNSWTASQNFNSIGAVVLNVSTATNLSGTLAINTDTPGQNGYVLTFENGIADWREPSGGNVSSVSNVDGSIIASPTTGDVHVGINFDRHNTWTGEQDFGLINATTANVTNLGTNQIAIAAGSEVNGNVLTYNNGAGIWAAPSAGAVTSVSNSNGSLTISPTTGDVVGSINLGHANHFTAKQTFDSAQLTTGAGANKIIQGDASGNMSWVTPSAAGVSSVTNSDGSITFSPTTGDVVGSINLANSNGWTGQQYASQATLTDATTISWNANTQQAAFVTLAGNRTLALPSNLQAGATYTLIIKQDGTGSRTLAFASGYKWNNGSVPVLTTAANAIDIITFLTDGTSMYGTIANNFS